jgi:hypothetical protein
MLKRLVFALFLCALGTILVSSQDAAAAPDADLDAALKHLNETPALFNFTTDTVKTIYARGLVLGNRPQVFTKIGDSDTTQGGFLRPIGMGPYPGFYCDLGEYDALQETIDYYSSVSPLNGFKNSFDSESITAHKGFSTSSLLDYLWAESDLCVYGELPTECEYRVVRPASVIIMLGLMDIQYFTVDEYKANMSQIIETSEEMGVIPILTTFVVMRERTTTKLDWRTSILFNNALIELSEDYQIPLINLWREAQSLPDSGIGADETHLAYPVGEFCNFTGSEHLYGGTLRNLLTLQGLNILRTEVFEAVDGD